MFFCLFITWQRHVLPDCVSLRVCSFSIGAPGYRTSTLGLTAIRCECGYVWLGRSSVTTQPLTGKKQNTGVESCLSVYSPQSTHLFLLPNLEARKVTSTVRDTKTSARESRLREGEGGATRRKSGTAPARRA